MNISLIECPSGDWQVLKINNKIWYEGHRIPSSVWLDVLYHANVESVTTKEISDEDMEEGKYYGTE